MRKLMASFTGADLRGYMSKTVDIDGIRVKLQVVEVPHCNSKHCFCDLYLRCRFGIPLSLERGIGVCCMEFTIEIPALSSSAMISLLR
jgi:hypothetical protein